MAIINENTYTELKLAVLKADIGANNFTAKDAIHEWKAMEVLKQTIGNRPY